MRAVSPTFTGVPEAPTAVAGTNTTQLATTSFVTTAVASGVTNINTISADYTALETDYTLLCDATSGFTLTLPSPSSTTGKVYIIRKIDETDNALNISPAISISNVTTISSLNFSKTIKVQSNGSNWYLID